MRKKLKDINTSHYEALSRLFVLQVALVAACVLGAVNGPDSASAFLFLLNLFVWPLVAAWPARRGWMLRGAVTNGFAILFLLAYYSYAKGRFDEWLSMLPVLVFGLVSGMAGGGLVDRWRSQRQQDSFDDNKLTPSTLVFPRTPALQDGATAGVHVSEWQSVSPLTSLRP